MRSQRQIAAAARAAGAELIEGPVSVVLAFDYEQELTIVSVKPTDLGKTTRPDIDNLVKNVLDALNGVAWEDDNQVAVLYAIKVGKGKRT